MNFKFLVFLLFCSSHLAIAQNNTEIKDLKKQLQNIIDRDQKCRTGKDSADFMSYIDSCNLAQVETIISKYGWLGKSKIGKNGNMTLFLVIQHADLETQKRYLPLLQKSVEEEESEPADLALLQDRILMRENKKQIYGSQVVPNKTTGALEFYPIDDEKNVDVRRKKVGLMPLEKYAKYFDINYKLPSE